MLGKPVEEYVTWIMSPRAWGGAIELKILAEDLCIEIANLDIETLHCYLFNGML